MLDQVRNAIGSIPVAIMAFAVPPLIWAQIAWLSSFLKTQRHGASGLLSILSGSLMSASMLLDRPTFPMLFIGAAAALAAMLIALLWPNRMPPKQGAR